jgi:tetratricopeptide (TPR) repeat protein
MTDTPHDSPADRDEVDTHREPLTEEQFRRQMRQAAHLLTTGQGEDAIPLLKRCRDLHPEDVDVLVNLGGAYILAGRHRLAVPLLERASELDPDNPAVWSNLAAAYLGQLVLSTRARQDRALAAYQRVVELDAAYPNVHYNMGLIYIDRSDWDAAYTALTCAIQSNPHDEDALALHRRVDQLRAGSDTLPSAN